jgi:hypothetical protein
MFTRRVLRGEPERMFAIMRNASAATAPVGGAAFLQVLWNTSNDGKSFTYYSSTLSQHPWQLLGAVASSAIPPGDYGVIQIHGIHDRLHVTGYGGDDPAWNWTTIKSRVLVPYAPGGGVYWYFTPTLATSASASISLGFGAFVHPIREYVNSKTTVHAAMTGNVPGLIRAM